MFDKMTIKNLSSLLTTTSKLSHLELPSLLLGIMALIPGFLDETAFGIGAIAVFGVVTAFRNVLKNNRIKIIAKLNDGLNKGNDKEIKEAMKALNVLTIAGGEKTDNNANSADAKSRAAD